MLDILQTAAKEGGEVLLDYFSRQDDLVLQVKTTHQDFSTQADLEAQEIISKSIIRQCTKKGIDKNEIGFIGEENLHIHGKHLFIIDPLDGTANFASGLEHFSVSIGYIYNGSLEAGFIYEPIKNISFAAQKGKGAYKQEDGTNTRLSIKKVPLKDCVMNAHFSSVKKVSSQLFPMYQKLLPRVRKLREYGAVTTSMACLATNIFGLVINGHCMIWDIAAAKLIIEEAGGTLVDFTGKEVVFDTNQPKKAYKVIACHPSNVEKIIHII
ncbi:MAG: inositol monophosphatase family protein [Candidatus Paceibacterota bacterium]